jgi:hypothetical protein
LLVRRRPLLIWLQIHSLVWKRSLGLVHLIRRCSLPVLLLILLPVRRWRSIGVSIFFIVMMVVVVGAHLELLVGWAEVSI